MLLFISDQGSIPVVEGLLESAVRAWRDMRNCSFRLNSLETSQSMLVGAVPSADQNLCRGQHGGGAAVPRSWARSNIAGTYPSVPLGCSQVCGKHFLGQQLGLPWARLVLAASEGLRAWCLESSRTKELIKCWRPFFSHLKWWESQAKGCNPASRGAGEEPR